MFGKDNAFNVFRKVIMMAVLGILVGIILGLGFGVLIAWIASLFAGELAYNSVPLVAGAFLGMGTGAILGAIFGAVLGSKK